MISTLLEEMNTRVKPLLFLLRSANKLIWEAQAEGYEIELECWGSMGRKPTRNDIRLIKFEKNLVNDKGKQLITDPLRLELKKVNKELRQLEKEGYCIDITSCRPNGSIYLFLEEVQLILLSDDFNFQQYNSKGN